MVGGEGEGENETKAGMDGKWVGRERTWLRTRRIAEDQGETEGEGCRGGTTGRKRGKTWERGAGGGWRRLGGGLEAWWCARWPTKRERRRKQSGSERKRRRARRRRKEKPGLREGTKSGESSVFPGCSPRGGVKTLRLRQSRANRSILRRCDSLRASFLEASPPRKNRRGKKATRSSRHGHWLRARFSALFANL